MPTACLAAWPAVTVAIMANKFPSDFYVTCATVIPVLFLAVAVQTRFSEHIVRTIWVLGKHSSTSPGEATRGERWKRRVKTGAAYVGVQLLAWLAALTLVAGGVGELLALLALYRGSETGGGRESVFGLMLVLLAAVIGVTFVTLVRSAVSAALHEDETADDRHQEPAAGS